MKHLVWLLSLWICCVAAPAHADKIDERVDKVFQDFRSYENYTFKYPNGSGIAHADLRRILLLRNGDSSLLDKGVSLVHLLETRKRYGDRQYAVAATELNADIIWAAVGAPGVDIKLLQKPLQWAIDKAKGKITDSVVNSADSSLPGVAKAYGAYGSYVNAVAKYENIQKVIDAATERYAVAHLNYLVNLYINSGLIQSPSQDATVWAEWSTDLIDGNPVTLQKFINRDFPDERWFSVHEFCKSAWNLNQQLQSAEFKADIERYKRAVNASIKAHAENQLSISDATLAEGNGLWRDMVFTVSLTKSLPYDVSAKFSTVSGTAKAPADYYPALTGKVTVKAGQTSAILNVKLACDRVEEADESFRVRLSDPWNVLLGDSDAIGTIVDDDYAGQISIGDVTFTELNSGQKVAKLMVSFSQSALHPIEVRYETKDDSAKASRGDYISTSGTLLFKPGRTNLDVLVPVVGDVTLESDEKFFVKISADGYKITRSLGVGTIVNDDNRAVSESGKIAFGYSAGTSRDIYVINADGSNRTQLTFTGNNILPRFNKTGDLIVFESYRDGNSEIYLMRSDGSGLTRLTSNEADDGCPDFAENDSRIVFTSNRDGFDGYNGDKEAWIMDLEGDNLSRVTNEDNEVHDTRGVLGSSDLTYRADNLIYSIKSDGSDRKLICEGYYPFSSRDGKVLLFSYYSIYSYSLVSNHEKLIINYDGWGSFYPFTDPIFHGNGSNIFYVKTPREIYDSAQIHYYDAASQTSQFFQEGYQPSWAPGSVLARPSAAPTPSLSPSAGGS